MHITPRNVAARVQSAVCVLAVTVGLTVAPTLIATADAAAGRPGAASTECHAAQVSLRQAQRQQGVAKQKVAKAAKAVTKAKKAHQKAKVKKAKKVLVAAKKNYHAKTRAVQYRQTRARYACASPTSTTNAHGTGAKLSLLGLANGLPLGAIDASQLTSLLDTLLPGVADQLNPAQLTALLAGFNAGQDFGPTDALALLTGVVDPSTITSILGGSASPQVLTALIDDVISQLSGLGGGLPIPTGAFDPTALWQTFGGVLGALDPSQLGGLLALVTSALGGGSAFDLAGMTDLIDSLVPGISSQFDPSQLTTMLAGLNGGGLSAATLANLLGGQFSPAQLQSVINGTAGQALLGAVISQVMAQLATGGLGGLALPGQLGAGSITTLISTVTGLVTGILGGGGGPLPVVCGLIPIPGLCT